MTQSNVVVTGPIAAEGTYKNIVLKSSLGFEEQTREGYCIYHVKWNYDLGGAVVDIPDNVVISMEGGVISNGTLVGYDTQIIYDVPVDKAFSNVEFEGTWIDDDDKQDARITELERISGNRTESTIQPTHMGRVTLKPNVIRRDDVWFVYPYTFVNESETETTVDILVYYKDSKYYLPFRNVRHPKVITVAGQEDFQIVGEQKLDVGTASIEDIATALDLQEEQYMFYDDDDLVITMPDSSTVDAYTIVNDNWPLKNYTETDANLLTQQMISKTNTIYVIQYDYELATDITVPANCVLDFDGGKIDGVDANNKRKLIGNRTTIVGVNNRPIFGDNMLPLEGMFNNDTLYPEWFGIFPNADSDYTDRWNRIIESSTNTNTKIAVNAGTYKFYNPIVLHENTSIVGSETRPVFLFMPNDPNSELRFLTLLGTKITLKNIVIERPTNLRHTSVGIILGDVTNHVVAARCTIENVTVARFYSGLVFDYTWLVHLNNIESNYNVLGILAKGTETFIEGLMLEHNVVGLRTIKMDDSNENNVKIVNATIESNGIGAIIQSGYVSILNTYMEGNYPTEGVDGNEALNYSGLIGEYTSGADIVCGKTAEFVQALHIINCYIGHSKNYPSIFDIDKCYNFNIIGTKIENLKTTANTNIGLVNSITSAQFSSQRYDYLRPSCGINYKLSSLPIVDIRDFSKSIIDDYNRFILNYGICFTPTNCSQLVDNEKYYAYTSSVTNNASVKINIEGNHLPTKNCTLCLLLKIAKNVKTLEIEYSSASGTVIQKYIDNDKEYYDGNLKQISVFLPGYNNVMMATFKWSNTNEDYVAGDKGNSISIEGLFVYDGSVENMTFINEYPHYLTRSKMVDAEAALIIPNSTPSTHTYDVRNIGRPCLYYDSTNDKLVLRVGNIDKTLSFD